MAKSFFDKLEKGMNIEKLPEAEESSKIEELPEEEPSVVLAAAAPKPEKKEKKVKPKIEITSVKNSKLKKKTKKRKIRAKEEKTEEEKTEVKPTRQDFTLQNLGGPEGQLTVDVCQTDKEIIIQSAIAGVEPEDLDITIENDLVIIKGRREEKFIEEEKNYFYQECYWGRFSREIILPEEVDNSRAKAIMENGILTIRIPKTGKGKKRKITVAEDSEQ